MMKRMICVAALTLTAAASAQPVAGLGGGLEGLWLPQAGESYRASTSAEPWQEANNDALPIPAGGTLVLAELEGPGMITHLWNTVRSEEPFYSRLLVLRIYWDGEKHPSVEAPLGDFFGVGHGLDIPFDSIPVRVTSKGRARNCYWRMPFAKSARITVTNEGHEPVGSFYSYVDWVKLPALPADTPYFHAMYRQEHPAVMGQRYLLADIQGRGHYVGTVLNIRARYDSWYGEGDDFFFIDGETEPRLRGTGTEDYFCDAWGFREQQGPYYGATRIQIRQGGRNSVYRWHIADPIVFTRSLRAEIEHTGFPGDGEDYQERDDDFSSVAFWYQQEPHAAWPALPAGYERLYYAGRVANLLDSELNVAQKRERLEKMLAGKAVNAAPVWLKGSRFEGAKAPVRLKNPADLAATVHGVITPAPPVQAAPATVDLVLQPGEEQTVEVALSSAEAVPMGAVAPALMEWTFTYALEERAPLAVPLNAPLFVDAPFPIPRRKTAVAVDGWLDEWEDLPISAYHPGQIRISPPSWEGPEDCRFRFAVEQDDDYVYVAVETIDDVRLTKVNRPPWFQDGVEVRVDARPDPERSNWNEWGSEFEKFLFFAVLPGDTPKQQIIFDEEKLPEGAKAVCVRTEQGHSTEIAIPHAVLDAFRGQAWDALRINVAVDDFDSADGELVQYWWRPDWRFEQSYPGSGTFVRE